MAKYIVHILCVLLLVGCAALEASKRMSLLEDTLFAYENAVLFGNFRAANKFTGSKEAGRNDPDFNYLKGIKVTSYELLESTSASEDLKARLIVEMRYFHENNFTVKTLIDEQLWEYDETQKRWNLESGLPDFR